MARPTRTDPVHLWSVALLGLSPLYIVLTKVEPAALALAVRSLNGRALMGRHRNGALRNLALGVMLVVSLYLAGRSGLELWQRIGVS